MTEVEYGFYEPTASQDETPAGEGKAETMSTTREEKIEAIFAAILSEPMRSKWRELTPEQRRRAMEGNPALVSSAEAALTALESLSPGAPEGYVLVPREATEAMTMAYMKVVLDAMDKRKEPRPTAIWTAMLTAAPPAPETRTTQEKTNMTDEQIKHMANRFLMWSLPENFNPDAGISYTRPAYLPATHPGPTGTNLFGYDDAVKMVRHMIAELPAAKEDGHG